ncbi:WXG100 family type VII secretion target [Actinokineospora enzanensis]|uniref:WXG100 family type VII secretion target n=1 Tax=Actinokineospora enzanensis TaxID=155975 RepID=UPI0003794518|nr:hypothetical protein [Actinokineospora enzanensis]
MTTGYDDVRQWDADALDTSATNLRGRRDKLIGLQDELDDARKLPDWHGPAGERARNSLGETRNNAEILIAELSAVERAMQTASDDVSTLKSRVANNDSLAGTYQFRIAADGSIVDDKPADPPPRSRVEAEDRAEARQHRETIRKQLEQETKAILATAKNIDSALAQVMRLAQERKIGDHGANTLADARKNGEIEAQVIEMEQALRDAGLLTGPPASGHYRQWLENAVRRGVSVDTIKQMITDHHITPDDFRVLDGMEEIREDEDGDGTFKSYFLMPTNISGDDARSPVATRPRKTRDCPMAGIASRSRVAGAVLLVAALTTACDTKAQFAPSLPPAAGFRVDDGVLKLWTGTPCDGVTGLRLIFDSGTAKSAEQEWTAPRPGVTVEHMDLLRTAGGSAPDTGDPLQVRQPLPADYDWTTAASVNFSVDGPVANGARVDVAQVLRESARHPSGSYLFGSRGWLDASDVQRENRRSFLTVCTPDPGR